MLQNLREHIHGWIAGVIVAILCLAFALWGMEYYLSGNSDQKTVAKVNGEEITQSQVAVVYKQLRNQQHLEADSGVINDFLQKQLNAAALNKLVNQYVLAEAAIKAGFAQSNEQLGAILAAVPAFQQNGQFSQEMFQRVIANYFPSQQAFFTDLRQNALTAQVKMGIETSAFSLPNEIDRQIELLEQKRDISYINIPTDKFLATVKISDADINDYYKKHQQDFMTPEQVSLQYILLSMEEAAKKVSVTEQELNQYYQDNKAEFSTPDQWQIARITIKIAPDADQKAIAAAQAKADAASKQLASGQDFAKVALQYSDDKPTAIQGGMIGWVNRLQQTPAMVQAVSALQPGQVSVPFQTNDGLAIVKLLAIKSGDTMPFASVQAQVEKNLRQQKVEQLIANDSEQLANITYTNPDTLKVASDTLGLPIQTTEYFTSKGGKSGISANPKVIAVAFSDNVLKQHNNSDLINLDSQSAVVIRVADSKPAAIRPLTEVRGEIEAILTAQAAKNAAQTLGTKILADLKSGVAAEKIAQENALTVVTKPQLGREAADVPAAIRKLAFDLPVPSAKAVFGGTALPDGGYAIVLLTKVQNGVPSAIDAQKRQQLQDAITNQFAIFDYSLYVVDKMSNAKIKYEAP